MSLTEESEYLKQVREASEIAHAIVAKEPSHEFMDVFHALMNLYLTPEERLYNGVIKHTYLKCFQINS